jgi:hypothetical protein
MTRPRRRSCQNSPPRRSTRADGWLRAYDVPWKPGAPASRNNPCPPGVAAISSAWDTLPSPAPGPGGVAALCGQRAKPSLQNRRHAWGQVKSVRSLVAALRSCCVIGCWASRCRPRGGVCWPVFMEVSMVVAVDMWRIGFLSRVCAVGFRHRSFRTKRRRSGSWAESRSRNPGKAHAQSQCCRHWPRGGVLRLAQNVRHHRRGDPRAEGDRRTSGVSHSPPATIRKRSRRLSRTSSRKSFGGNLRVGSLTRRSGPTPQTSTYSPAGSRSMAVRLSRMRAGAKSKASRQERRRSIHPRLPHHPPHSTAAATLQPGIHTRPIRRQTSARSPLPQALDLDDLRQVRERP